MRLSTIAFSIAVTLVGVARIVDAQRPSTAPTVDIGTLMTANEFKNAGLSKLSPEEIRNLNDWLSKLLVAAQRQTTPSLKSTCSPAIESEIDGTFNGWSGDTIFKLANGQIWQQSEYDYDYEYDYRPDVTIYQTAGGCKMKVEGVDDTILVKRIK